MRGMVTECASGRMTMNIRKSGNKMSCIEKEHSPNSMEDVTKPISKEINLNKTQLGILMKKERC